MQRSRQRHFAAACKASLQWLLRANPDCISRTDSNVKTSGRLQTGTCSERCCIDAGRGLFMPRSMRLADILGAIAGIAFVVLVFVSVASVDPQKGVSDDELQTWWSDSGNRNAFVISTYTLLAASPLFLMFVSRLRTRLRSADGSGWADIVYACGIVATVGLGMCGLLRGVVARSMRFDDEPLPGVDTLRFATYLAFTAWDLVILFVAVLVAVVSVMALTTRVLPRWYGWLGAVVAIGCLAMIAMQSAPFAIPLMHVWVLAGCVHLLRTPTGATALEPARQVELAGAGAD